MAYTVGQIKKGSNNELYSTVLVPEIKRISAVEYTVQFQNPGFDYNFVPNKCYCFRCQINTYYFGDRQIKIRLVNNTSSLVVAEFSVYWQSNIEVVFQPNNTYNQLVVEVTRTSSDFAGAPIDIELQDPKLFTVHNLLNGEIPSTMIKQLGVQGRPGLLMVIDGEAIKIGRTGIYQLHEGVSIRYFGVVVASDEDKFLIDYKY